MASVDANSIQMGSGELYFRAQNLGLIAAGEVTITGLTPEVTGVGSSLTGTDGAVAAFAGDGHTPRIKVKFEQFDKYHMNIIFGDMLGMNSVVSTDPLAGYLTGGTYPGARILPHQLVWFPHTNYNGTKFGSDTSNKMPLEFYKAVPVTPLDMLFSTSDPFGFEVEFMALHDLSRPVNDRCWRLHTNGTVNLSNS